MATIHINRGGTNLGTFSEADISSGLRTGRFLGSDLAWREGMSAWKPLSQFTEFAGDLAAASALPPQTPPSGDATPPPGGAAPPPGPGAPAPAPLTTTAAATATDGLPWDRRMSLGIVKAFIDTLQMVLMRPSEAFAAMKREGGLGEPLIYGLIGGTIGTIVGLVYRLGLQSVTSGAFGVDCRSYLAGTAGAIAGIIFSPVFVAIGIFIIAAILHVCLMIVGGARRPFETTFRVVCFTVGSANPLQIVPICGGAICFVWGIVLYCIGLARAHEIDSGRAVMAVLLPLIVCCGGIVLLVMLVGGAAGLSHAFH